MVLGIDGHETSPLKLIKENDVIEYIKPEHHEITTLKRGDFLWVASYQPLRFPKPILLIFLKWVEKEGVRQALVRNCNSCDTEHWSAEELQAGHETVFTDHPDWRWEVSPFSSMSRFFVLYFADEDYDPSRYSGFEAIAPHVPRELPELWEAWLKADEEYGSDAASDALQSIAQQLLAEHRAKQGAL